MSIVARRYPGHEAETQTLFFDHVSVTATTTWKFFKCPRPARVKSCVYLNVTGLAEDTTNVFEVAVKNGSTSIAAWSTDSDLLVADASIPANTHLTLTASATDADAILAADDVLSLVATEGGTATLPAGRIQVELVYL